MVTIIIIPPSILLDHEGAAGVTLAAVSALEVAAHLAVRHGVVTRP